MTQLPDHIGFEEWVNYAFDHPVSDPAWHFEFDSEWWDTDARPEVTVSYMTRLFENPVGALRSYSDAQINQGLWFIAHNACSDHMFAVLDAAVPLPQRVKCIQSMYTLFERLFAARCSAQLSHSMRSIPPSMNPLNSACYMWWDLIPFCGNPDEPERKPLDEACLNVMEKTLRLPSIACQEGALHGLGHWSATYPDRVESIVERYLQNRFDLPPEIASYALSARQGCVL